MLDACSYDRAYALRGWSVPPGLGGVLRLGAAPVGPRPTGAGGPQHQGNRRFRPNVEPGGRIALCTRQGEQRCRSPGGLWSEGEWRRDGRGRFYSAGAFGVGNIITVWDDGGRFLKSFGREGDGPGEFSERGMITIFVDREDRLHVRDGGFRWSVFSPEQGFLGSVFASVASFQTDTSSRSGGSMGNSAVFFGGPSTGYRRMIQRVSLKATHLPPR